MEKLQQGRVVFQTKNLYFVRMETNEQLIGTVSGHFQRQAQVPSDFPVIGDWVEGTVYDEGKFLISAIRPRHSLITRKIAGMTSDSQPIAANIDTVFICMSANHDFNLPRLERYLYIAWDSGANPVILLTKTDLITEKETVEQLRRIEEATMGVPVISINQFLPIEERLTDYLTAEATVVFVGSSGVGKSTLTNQLLATARQETKEIREEDSKGRHTTTSRTLFYLENGCSIIDTPGMREVGIVTGFSENHSFFEEIESLTHQCKFTDCQHETEPSCAVQQAIKEGTLSPDRLRNYRKLEAEKRHNERRQQYKEKLQNKKSRKK
ncbi:ribosome small subunit-dependent GTPase A [Enterococcus sp. AZ194]|uniref:ribosome small subunit-dependent GTPase A n=1 Tax=Enterococcus sp. AZ194 TaxID=2774629 RepID=UPI003F2001A6